MTRIDARGSVPPGRDPRDPRDPGDARDSGDSGPRSRDPRGPMTHTDPNRPPADALGGRGDPTP